MSNNLINTQAGTTNNVSNTSNNAYDAVLVGGLDYRAGDYSINQQVDLLKKGIGFNKNVKGFRYNTSTTDVLNFISQNPKIPIFLFSAGCAKSGDISKNPNVDNKKLYIIEPYAPSQNTTNTVRTAVSNGVPASNVFVGNSQPRGKGIVNGASNSNSPTHFGALTSVGLLKSDNIPTRTAVPSTGNATTGSASVVTNSVIGESNVLVGSVVNNTKEKTNEVPPETPKEYNGEQIQLSSGRLVLNARSDNAFLNAQKYINLSAGEKVTIDVGIEDSDKEQNMFLVNAPRMQLGLDINGKPEPITKADELEKILIELIDAISLYSNMVQSAAIAPGPLMSALLTPATTMLRGKLTQVKANMVNFKSTKSFTI
jgi:hypothetical protein